MGFAGSLVSKQYVCLCCGEHLGASGVVAHANCKLKWTLGGSLPASVHVAPDGRRCLTHFDVLATYLDPAGEDLTCVLARPATGFTHQIRVHMSSMGRPLIGDTLYNRGSLSATT